MMKEKSQSRACVCVSSHRYARIREKQLAAEVCLYPNKCGGRAREMLSKKICTENDKWNDRCKTVIFVFAVRDDGFDLVDSFYLAPIDWSFVAVLRSSQIHESIVPAVRCSHSSTDWAWSFHCSSNAVECSIAIGKKDHGHRSARMMNRTDPIRFSLSGRLQPIDSMWVVTVEREVRVHRRRDRWLHIHRVVCWTWNRGYCLRRVEYDPRAHWIHRERKKVRRLQCSSLFHGTCRLLSLHIQSTTEMGSPVRSVLLSLTTEV